MIDFFVLDNIAICEVFAFLAYLAKFYEVNKMYDDNFDLWNVSDNDNANLENTVDYVSGNDSLSDVWLDPLGVHSSDVSTNDFQENITYSEVDLSQIESSLSSIERYCNLGFTLLFFYISYRFVRSVIYRFNTKGKDIS